MAGLGFRSMVWIESPNSMMLTTDLCWKVTAGYAHNPGVLAGIVVSVSPLELYVCLHNIKFYLHSLSSGAVVFHKYGLR